MLKNFMIGCLTIIVMLILIPILVFIAKIAWWIAIPIGVVVGAFIRLIFIDKIVRFLIREQE